jgi:hypothetical protein
MNHFMPSDAEEIKRLRDTVAGLERAAQRLAVRDAAVRAISGYSSLAQAGPETLRAVCEALGWQVGVLWVVEPLAGILRCVDVWRAPSMAFPEFEAASRRSTFSRGVGLPGRVWSTAQPVWIRCISEDSNFPRMPIAASEGLVAALGFRGSKGLAERATALFSGAPGLNNSPPMELPNKSAAPMVGRDKRAADSMHLPAQEREWREHAAVLASAFTVICGIGMMVFAQFGKFREAGIGLVVVVRLAHPGR